MRFCGGSILKLRVERKRADATANFEDNAAHVRVHTIAKRTSNLALIKYTVKHLIGHGLEWFHVYGQSYLMFGVRQFASDLFPLTSALTT